MNTQIVYPFLESAETVLQQVANVNTSSGEIAIKDIKLAEEYIWIKIGVNGQLSGDVVFGIEEQVALALISKMMGGFEVNEIDAIGLSAISELGNMISGNASVMLSNKGINLEITPPEILEKANYAGFTPQEGSVIPIELEGIGEFKMLVAIL